MSEVAKRGGKGRRAAPDGTAQPADPMQPAGRLSDWQAPQEPRGSPEPPAPGGRRLVLPPSGTAEEILGGPAAQPYAPAPIGRAHVAPEAVPAARAVLSFFGAHARDEAEPPEATEHLLTFLLDREEYGVEVRLVQEIVRVPEITPVPRAPEFIRGVVNLRGRIIPVVDLKRKLRLGEHAATRDARIVVVRLRERLIGLLVDAAAQVLKVPAAAICAAPEEAVEIEARLIRGVAKLERRLIILIDLQQALSLELREEAVP